MKFVSSLLPCAFPLLWSEICPTGTVETQTELILSSHQRLLPECGYCPALIYAIPKQSFLRPALLLFPPLVTLLIILDFLLKPISCCPGFGTLFCSIFNDILLSQQHFSHVLYHNLMLPVFVLNLGNEVSGNSVSLNCITSANWRLLN